MPIPIFAAIGKVLGKKALAGAAAKKAGASLVQKVASKAVGKVADVAKKGLVKSVVPEGSKAEGIIKGVQKGAATKPPELHTPTSPTLVQPTQPAGLESVYQEQIGKLKKHL